MTPSDSSFSLAENAVTLDEDRSRRCGFPEVIYAEGKTVEAVQAIVARLLEQGERVLATRVSAEQAAELVPMFPQAQYNQLGRTLRVDPEGTSQAAIGHVAVITAGTSDRPVSEEVRETLGWMGVQVTMIYDVGVAGPHRLPSRLAEFESADVVVVAAGMEGALPSVVGGYVGCPVIAVPTSVGYGASLGGIAALLSMLNSCAANVTVVNIDAGFKAGYLAGLIVNKIHAK
ncbi:nickel pincer cofactor biosynthesis protein LarB [Aeoliella mucimassa]|uniref:N5-carboxyaminoimidazole ribonucleotide mutase n=1 Tax=Aeoliella mucimassa TaxID=2527972 RepID=A0A518AI78_9BACT|nr:nickel pincer cofactor biosynthesis protein LarB [Aeoliella mucimassa]QDU54432.1 N5-carboxyaminoimidazole ribonucleotide mutase [Aeoliella mucimassa]